MVTAIVGALALALVVVLGSLGALCYVVRKFAAMALRQPYSVVRLNARGEIVDAQHYTADLGAPEQKQSNAQAPPPIPPLLQEIDVVNK